MPEQYLAVHCVPLSSQRHLRPVIRYINIHINIDNDTDLYLHVFVNHEVKSIQVEISDFAL